MKKKNEVVIKEQKGYELNPARFLYQMQAYDAIKSELLDYINSRIENDSLKLSDDELCLKNEFNLFEEIRIIFTENTERNYDLMFTFGNTAIRFNMLFDKLLTILGYDYMIKKSFFERMEVHEGHPIIVDYGTAENKKGIIKIDRNASYSFINNKNEFMEPVVINEFEKESDFVKQIVKRALGAYFYKDIDSPAIYQKVLLPPLAGIKVSLGNFLLTYVSMLDILINMIDLVFDLNLHNKYEQITVRKKKENKIEELPEGTKANVNWALITETIDELKAKNTESALDMSNLLEKYKPLINDGKHRVTAGRNIIMHKGELPMWHEYTFETDRGIFISFDTSFKKIKEDIFFDAVKYFAEHYSIMHKLYNEYYFILKKALLNGETFFKKAQEINFKKIVIE